MVLALIVLVPLLAGLMCLATRSRTAWEWLNLLAFAIVGALAIVLAANLLSHGTITGLGGFLRADALSTLVVLLIAFVALGCAIYAVGYFRRMARFAMCGLRHCHRGGCGGFGRRAATRGVMARLFPALKGRATRREHR